MTTITIHTAWLATYFYVLRAFTLCIIVAGLIGLFGKPAPFKPVDLADAEKSAS